MPQPPEKTNELFRYADQLPEALWSDLAARPPAEAAAAVGAVWHDGCFKIPLVGLDYTVNPAERLVQRTGQPDHRVSYQSGVVLLTTLAGSKGVPPSGRMTTPQELPGGRLFFTGAHCLLVEPLARKFQDHRAELTARTVALGGRILEPRGADWAIGMPGLPCVPLYVLFFSGNEEYAARAIIGIDDRAHFHLDLSGVFALTNILAGRLLK